MKFEVGKCYEHITGQKIRMLQEIDTYFYGHCILGETDSGKYILCGLEKIMPLIIKSVKILPRQVSRNDI